MVWMFLLGMSVGACFGLFVFALISADKSDRHDNS